MSAISIHVLDDELRRYDWDEYVATHANSSAYHQIVWRDIIARVFRQTPVYLYAETNGAICGVLPMVRLKSRMFGDFMVSLPYFNYGGVVADSSDVEQLLLQEAIDLGLKDKCSHVEIRDVYERENWPTRTDKVTMLLDLPTVEDDLWKALGAKRRSQINRPLREGVTARDGGVELLDDFYKVFSRNMRDLGTPVYSKIFFKTILELIPKETFLVVVYLDEKPVGAGFLVGYRDTLEIPWASTVREVNNIGVNMYLYWEVIKRAIAKGYKRFDFGRSTVDSGTYRFKKQWGAKPKQLYWHYWMSCGGDLPKLNPNNPKYRLLISVWQKMPLVLANWMGPKIVRNLP